MDLIDAIRRRRAVRDYKPDAPPMAVLRQLISAAAWAPSAMNEQPWHFTVVTDRPLLDEISACAKKEMLHSLETTTRPAHFHDVLSDPHYNIFYNAPALIVISAPADRPWNVEDCAMAAENMMLAACNQGLGSCWIGFAQNWLNSVEGLRALGLPRSQRVVAPIIVGHPKAEAPPVPRKQAAINWIGGSKTDNPARGEPPPGLHDKPAHP